MNEKIEIICESEGWDIPQTEEDNDICCPLCNGNIEFFEPENFDNSNSNCNCAIEDIKEHYGI